jgi:DNA repair protein RecN (Recombination protein N)
LLDAASHRALLDAYGGHAPLLAGVAAAWAAMQAAAAALTAARGDRERAVADLDFIRHAAAELDALDPQPGEDQALAEQRALLQSGEKLAAALADAAAALEDGGGVESRLRLALRALERVADKAAGRLDAPLQAIERALAEAGEAGAALAAAARALDLDPRRLERAEERLFALRAAARKHQVGVDDLPRLRESFRARLAAIDDGGAALRRLEEAAEAQRGAYAAAAAKLGSARRAASARLDKAVAAELKPLRLGAARFVSRVEPLAEDDWSADGTERVGFLVATNPGAAPGPIAKIASGGELSRFMLALKVVLAARGAATTLVFDEVDRGIGGATADAVGERLARLARDVQVLVVTHSPQVAARGGHHWRIAKEPQGNGKAVVTRVEPLDGAGRREELARMLAGAKVTEAARAAAASLIAQVAPGGR